MAIGERAYVPILKAREAEIKAVLRAPRGLDVTPLFELQPASAGGIDPATGEVRRSKRTTTDASYFLDDIARLWDGPLYVDIGRIAKPQTRATWWQLLASLNSLAPEPAQLIPVLVPGSTESEMRSAALAAGVTERLALRVTMIDATGKPDSLRGVISAIARATQIPESRIDVVLDWGDATELRSLDDLEADTLSVMKALRGDHGTLITSGTPNSTDFTQVGDWDRPRFEWLLWLRLARSGLDVVYGDYALYPPADPVPVQPQYGHLRYSSGDRLYVHRRAKPATGGGLAGAFQDCCAHVVGQSHWLGSQYSRADARIDDIARAADKESTPGKWRQLAAEHHFVLVADQLTNPLAPLVPGTP